MNTSRDIEKLFDHFGGDADGYQEIGRENEAKSARTRWPLLATLDLAQPAIPEIKSRRQAGADGDPSSLAREPEHAAENARPTSIRRGKPPLFARAHRRTIPRIDPHAGLGSLSERFSSPADAVAPAEPDAVPPPAVAAAASPPGRMGSPGAQRPATADPADPAYFAGFAAVRRSATSATSATSAAEAEPGRASACDSASAASSILGRLFTPKAAEPASAPPAADGSLVAVFDRLRGAGESARPNRATLAARLPRS